jgi:Sec-independent protein translocase protein TatA
MSIYKKLREAVNEVRKATDNPKDRRDLKRMAQLHGQQETPKPKTPTDEESDEYYKRLQAEKKK